MGKQSRRPNRRNRHELGDEILIDLVIRDRGGQWEIEGGFDAPGPFPVEVLHYAAQYLLDHADSAEPVEERGEGAGRGCCPVCDALGQRVEADGSIVKTGAPVDVTAALQAMWDR